MIMASEVGVLDIPPEDVLIKGRLDPGKMFLVDIAQGRIVDDEELKHQIAAAAALRQVARRAHGPLGRPARAAHVPGPDHETLLQRQQAFGYTLEDLKYILSARWRTNGEEAIGSMGTDTPLAVLSDRPQPLFNYFKQLFAQVTNPPLDAIREELVTSIGSTIGPRGEPARADARDLPPDRARDPDPRQRRAGAAPPHASCRGFKSATAADALPGRRGGRRAGAGARGPLRRPGEPGDRRGANLLILSDRGVDASTRRSRRSSRPRAVTTTWSARASGPAPACVIESGDAREVHHFALLLGYGAGTINPYVAFETLDDMIRQGLLPGHRPRRGRQELPQGDQEGGRQGDVQDGHQHASRATGAPRSSRRSASTRSSSTATSTRPPRGSAASASRRSPRRRSRSTTAPSRPAPVGPPSSTGAASTSGAATASSTCSTPRPSSGSSTPRAAASTGSSRSTPRSSTTRTATLHAPRPLRVPARRDADPDRGGRAGRVDRQAVRHRRHVLRLDQPEAHETLAIAMNRHRRQDQHRRGRRGLRAVPPRCRTATGGGARSSRSPRAGSA